MKKVLIVICISAFLASCGGDTKSTEVKTDSTTTTITTDATSKMAPADTTIHVMTDSTSKMIDSTKK
ncbi:MAG: hypothetical protein ABI416_00265 [Ginsengibacter sp.]